MRPWLPQGSRFHSASPCGADATADSNDRANLAFNWTPFVSAATYAKRICAPASEAVGAIIRSVEERGRTTITKA